MSDNQFQPEFIEEDESQLSLLALKKTREKQGLSIAEVSDRLKISVNCLKALESNDIDSLPGLAFARGYIRTYGRFLGLDADALIRDFNAIYGSDARQQVRTINRVKPQAQLGDPIIRISLVVFVLIIIGSSIWWWQTQMGKEPASAVSAMFESSLSAVTDQASETDDGITGIVQPAINPKAQERVDGASGGAANTEAEPAPQDLSDEDIERMTRELGQSSPEAQESPAVPSLVEDEQGAEGRAVVLDTSDSVEAIAQPISVAAVAEEQASAEKSTEVVATSLLKIRFSSDCWVSIKNADGKTVFANLIKGGETLERELASLPVQLLLGSSRSIVEAEFRGQPLLLAEHTKKGVARLTLK
ncbi:MAG: RodZ domain-containing protein [Motiliproteus sp.]